MDGKAFDNLRYLYVCTFLDILNTAQLNNVSNVERLFSENAEGFNQVMEFVQVLDVVAVEDRMLQLKIEWPSTDQALRSKRIFGRLLGKRNQYRSSVYRFVDRFVVVNGEIIYIPTDQDRSTDSGVRNFLIELGIVNYDMENGQYFLGVENAFLLANAKSGASVKTQTQLKKELKERRAIGAAAEELIIKYERSRIGGDYSDRVDHVSVWNTAAGYDIASLSIAGNSIVPRFVEVKAVPSNRCQFYWSRNEIEKARELSSFYFLYLVPVTPDRRLDIDGLTIIRDPYEAVLHRPSDWAFEPDALICRAKSEFCQ